MLSWLRSAAYLGLITGLTIFRANALLAAQPDPKGVVISPSAEILLTKLADGAYQFCTEPVPDNWLDGAGACLNIVKQGTAIDGYYGYPHSNRYVCLRGQVSEDWFSGEGLLIAWSGEYEAGIPEAELNWGQKTRLYLGQESEIYLEGIGEDQVSWILFEQTRLNMQGFYLYPSPKMTPPTQLCEWRNKLEASE